ncbi:MAG: hypothetical protein IJH82_08210 [Lachnospiraceae bacterium]|nr:hypothetical protein [Lachnospiraceae bacterium]
MKKMKKAAAFVIALSMVVLLLCGCDTFAKKKAFSDYGNSLQSDVPYWNDLSEASDQIGSGNDMTTMKAVIQSRIIPDLNAISNQASGRNATISDTEIKTIDTEYVNAVTHMTEAYMLILDGINNNDSAKMNKAMTELNVAMSSLQNYGNGLKAYCGKYGIDSSSIDGMLKLFN